MKIGTLISAGVLMLSSMILNSGCSEAGNGRKQTTENPGAIFGEVKSAAGAKMLTSGMAASGFTDVCSSDLAIILRLVFHIGKRQCTVFLS